MVDISGKILNVPYDDILYRLEFYGWYFANVTYGKDYLMQLSSTGVFWARYQKQKSPPTCDFHMYGTNPEEEWLRFLNDNNIDASKLPLSVYVNFMAPLWIIHAKESTWKDELRQLFLGLGYAILTLAVPVILGKLLGWAMEGIVNWSLMRSWLQEIAAAIENAILKAKASQKASGYLEDIFTGTNLPKGTKIYGGLPGQTAWYTNFEALEKSGYSRSKLFQGLQVKPHPELGYRSQIGGYELLEDTTLAEGKALANSQYGDGGYYQYFIENYNGKLKLVETINLGD